MENSAPTPGCDVALGPDDRPAGRAMTDQATVFGIELRPGLRLGVEQADAVAVAVVEDVIHVTAFRGSKETPFACGMRRSW